MVDFVGAGCGAADLITVRGMRLLQQADVVIYAGSLINPELLSYTKEGCELHNSAEMTLEEIISVIQSSEKAGRHTVRLQTGDLSLYGALREQTDKLAGLGIPYRITPGVSSMFGAAAALKAEYTLPGVSQSVIITRCTGRTEVPLSESIESFAAHGCTMVIFLSAGMTEKVSTQLINGGFAPDIPAAIVYKATHPDERVLRCTVGTLHETAVRNGISNTALIIVGNVLGDEYELSKLYDKEFETGFRKV
ncbi:MAG: precorrin-4 C(11)-methyltransferase [Ruminiclostridium sp.]|nr:precorrin-4 C(11)-methyltransferase [Ruminiclostridium sp.]